MLNDLRHAVRFLWSHKAFTAAAVLTLAIGLGANTALYGLLNAALKPLPVPDAGQIVTIAAEPRNDESGGFQYTFSTDAVKDLQQRTTTLSDVFAAMPRIGGLAADGKAAQFFFVAVSDNYFSGLRLSPYLGSLFSKPSGSPASVVLGYAFWRRHFGGDPHVIGRAITVDGHPAVITGVVPPAFHGTFMAVELDGYLTIDDLAVVDPDVNTWLYHNRGAKPTEVFGRLKPGVSLADANRDVTSVLATLGAEFPATDAGVGARVMPEPLSRPLPMRAVSDVIPLVQLFGMAVAGLVLLLACMNVANLLLVRASARQRELAVRAALGATPARLVRQMMAEGVLLAVLGGAAGVVMGQWVMRAFIARLDFGADLPFALDVTFDLRVFAFSFVAAVATGALIGLWPAWRASRADARAALHDGGKGGSDGVDRQRLRRLLVVGQIAGSLALLVVAGLFVRSLRTAQTVDLGFDADHLASVRLDARQAGFDPDRAQAFFTDATRRISAWPDVTGVATAFTVPTHYLAGGGAIFIEGEVRDPSAPPQATFGMRVGPGYFDTMGIPLVRGRAFREDDQPATSEQRRVVIVNETMAARFWPGKDPIGKRLKVWSEASPWLEIVGVAKDSKTVLVFEQPRPYFYLALEKDLLMRTLIVRAAGDPASLLPRLEHELYTLSPDMPQADLRTMKQTLGGFMGDLIFRVGAIQAGGMGLIGLALAIIGVYGVVSFGASLRTREIGIRMALGAQPADVVRLILGQGVLLVFVGLAAGLTAAALLGRTLMKILPLVNAADWLTFTSVSAGLAALALLACYIPARRATKVPAMTALRHE